LSKVKGEGEGEASTESKKKQEAPQDTSAGPSNPDLQFEVPERPSSGKKIGSRILTIIVIIALLAGIGGFGYWFFALRNKGPEGPSDYTTQEACESADFHWYDNNCHQKEEEEEEVVRPKTPSDYKKESTCTKAGHYWYKEACHEKPQPEPEPTPPVSLIKVDQTKVLTASSSKEATSTLNNFLGQDLKKGFTRILIKNETK